MEFLSAKKSIEEFREIQAQVSSYVDEVYDGRFVVSYDVESQSINVEIVETDSQMHK